MVEITEEMVERGAKVLHRRYMSEYEIADWTDLSESDRWNFLGAARAVLEAALSTSN